MGNLRRINPNEIVLGSNHPFAGTKLGIPSNFEEIRSFAELRMRPRNSNYVEITDNQVIGKSFKGIDYGDNIVLTGYKTRGGQNYYSTNYTEDGDKNYEGFGIQNISITFDANKIPQITVSFYDVRGNVLNNFNSKFAKMFQLPYPIFELRIKGGFGPTVTYRLRKIKDDISIDDSGNFTIKSKFIGDRFSPLSDFPIAYLGAVPYLKGGTVKIDNNIESFHELMIRSKKFYERLGEVQNSNQQQQYRQEIQDLKSKRDRLQNIVDILSNKDKIFEWFNGDADFDALSSPNKTQVENWVKAATNASNITTFPNVLNISYPLSNESLQVIQKVFDAKLLQYRNQIVADGYSATDISETVTTVTLTIAPFTTLKRYEQINYVNVVGRIGLLNSQIAAKEAAASASLNTSLQQARTDILGGTRLKIGTVFKFMLDDYNYMMDRIKQAGDQGGNDTGRYGNSTFDRLGFPTVVEADSQGGKKMIYPGSKTQFKSWPEVKFIDEFVEAYIKAQTDALRAEMNNSVNEDGSSKYIPINPREIYKLDTTRPDPKELADSPQNIYYQKTTEEIGKLLHARYLIFTNLNLAVVKNVDDGIWDAQTVIFDNWKFNGGAFDFTDWVTDWFNTGPDEKDIAKKIWLSTIESEARNIAFSLFAANQPTRDYFKQLENNLTSEAFLDSTTDPIAKGYTTPVSQNENTAYGTKVSYNNPMKIGTDISVLDKNYVSASRTTPQTIDPNGSANFIYDWMKTLNDEGGSETQVTKENVVFVPDKKASTSLESDYIIGTHINNSHVSEANYVGPILFLNIKLHVAGGKNYNFERLYNKSSTPCLIQVPKVMLIIMGAVLSSNAFLASSSQNVFLIDVCGYNFRIQKDSNIYYYLINIWNDIPQFKIVGPPTGILSIELLPQVIAELQPAANTAQRKAYLNNLFEKYYLSVNSIGFTDFKPAIENYNIIKNPDNRKKVYFRYVKELSIKLKKYVEELEQKLSQQIQNLEGSMRDNDVKLAIYKSFQVIYENYLLGHKASEYRLFVKDNFKFVDRAYNDISDVCVIDMKTLLSDYKDTNVSMFTAISRVLSDNNFWFYPFQGWITNTQNYADLFVIDYDQTITTSPMFVAMYVGGVSSNPNTTDPNNTLENDGITTNNLPGDFGKTTGGIDAFLVQYTGVQNQIVFSDFQHSTESLKNTDEGIRIQSEIINNASNSLSVPKGQSLLTVYQKQSYVSTVKIPFGNMGIQPTQYYYLEFIPIFEGLYIIYSVEHTIDASTQRLETSFKGYRLKKDVNPFVTDEITDYVRSSYPNSGGGGGSIGGGGGGGGLRGSGNCVVQTGKTGSSSRCGDNSINSLKNRGDFVSWAKGSYACYWPTFKNEYVVAVLKSSLPFERFGGYWIPKPSTTPPTLISSVGGTEKYQTVKYTPAEQEQFFRDVLIGLGAPATAGNIIFMKAWRCSEGGTAMHNPWNSILENPVRRSNYNGAGVQNYFTFDVGVQKTIETLKGVNRTTRQPIYKTVLAGLRRGLADRAEALELATLVQTYDMTGDIPSKWDESPSRNLLVTEKTKGNGCESGGSGGPPPTGGGGGTPPVGGGGGGGGGSTATISTTATVLTIGDSISRNLNTYNNNIKAIQSPAGSELTLAGHNSTWLLGQLKKAPPLPTVQKVVLSMGANDLWNLTTLQSQIETEMKRVFPSATQKFILQGHYGWGKGLSVTSTKTDTYWRDKINTYISFYQGKGFTVVGDLLGPIGHPGNRKGDAFMDAVARDLKTNGIS